MTPKARTGEKTPSIQRPRLWAVTALTLLSVSLCLGLLWGLRRYDSCDMDREILPIPRSALRAQQLAEAVPVEPSGLREAVPWWFNFRGKGYYFVASPDRSYLALSTRGCEGDSIVQVWNERLQTLTLVLTVGESDPGSGYSHRYGWSEDSKTLFILGSGSVAGRVVWDLRMAYFVETDTLQSLEDER